MEIVDIALHWALFAVLVSVALGILTFIAIAIWENF